MKLFISKILSIFYWNQPVLLAENNSHVSLFIFQYSIEINLPIPIPKRELSRMITFQYSIEITKGTGNAAAYVAASSSFQYSIEITLDAITGHTFLLTRRLFQYSIEITRNCLRGLRMQSSLRSFNILLKSPVNLNMTHDTIENPSHFQYSIEITEPITDTRLAVTIDVSFQYSIEITAEHLWSICWVMIYYFQYSIEITTAEFNVMLQLYLELSIFYWNHPGKRGNGSTVGWLLLSIFYWNHPPRLFLSGVLKLFLPVARFSWGRVSVSNAYGSCLFPRWALRIESMFPRNFNSHDNGLFPR